MIKKRPFATEKVKQGSLFYNKIVKKKETWITGLGGEDQK